MLHPTDRTDGALAVNHSSPADGPRRVSPMAVLRVVAAVLGCGVWAYWWAASDRLSPQFACGLWLGALGLLALACFSPWTIPRPTRTTRWAVMIIAVMVLPRVLSLSWAPYHISLDEIIHPLYGLDMLRERPWEIIAGTSSYFETPFLTQALQAWPCLVLEPLLGARLATVVLALVSLLSTYALAHRLFGSGAGFAALVVLACSYWHMAYSRLAHPYMQPIVLLPLALHVLLRGVSERHRFFQFIGGILLGLSLLVYTPARIVIPVFLAWLAHRLVTRTISVRRALGAMMVIALGAVLAVSPYVHRQGLRGVWARYLQTSMGPVGPLHQFASAGWSNASARTLLQHQFATAARIYYSPGAVMAVGDFSPAPLLDPVSLVLVLSGLTLAIARLSDDRCFLLVVWIAATFIAGQVLTDVPASAYRAAPLLPALAICAGLAASRIMAAARSRWTLCGRPVPQAAAVLAFLIVILPLNLHALVRYLSGSHHPWSEMARLIAAGSKTAAYYLVSSGPAADHELFRFLGGERRVRDVPSLMDTLGSTIDPHRDAVFVLSPGMAAAASAIRRCYPGALFTAVPSPAEQQPVLGLLVPEPAVAAGQQCAPWLRGAGLWARYFSGSGWDGTVVRERLEDWPPRWSTQEDGARFGSIEWTGAVRLPVAGEYRFQLLAPGAHDSAEIGGRVVVAAQQNAGAAFEAGTHAVRIRCTTIPGNLCWLRWAPPGSDFDAIPTEFLVPPADSDVRASRIPDSVAGLQPEGAAR